MNRIIPLVAALLTASSPVVAQSAGETALSSMTGRDGLDFGPTGGRLMDDATVSCDSKVGMGCRVTLTIRRLDTCRYASVVNDPEFGEIGTVTDFSKAARISFEHSKSDVPIDDTFVVSSEPGLLCAMGGTSMTCSSKASTTPDHGIALDQQRFTDAFAYMRRTLCPGRAY